MFRRPPQRTQTPPKKIGFFLLQDYWQALQSNKHLSIRFVTSGNWTYKVDFSAMTQTNTTSNMCRPIRRVP